MAYAPCLSQNQNAVQITLEQIDLIIRLVSKYPEHMKLALSADGELTYTHVLRLRAKANLSLFCVDIVEAHKEGKIASLIGKQV